MSLKESRQLRALRKREKSPLGQVGLCLELWLRPEPVCAGCAGRGGRAAGSRTSNVGKSGVHVGYGKRSKLLVHVQDAAGADVTGVEDESHAAIHAEAAWWSRVLACSPHSSAAGARGPGQILRLPRESPHTAHKTTARDSPEEHAG